MGRQLHTVPSHRTVDEPQHFSWGVLTINHHKTKGNNSAQQTRDTTTEIWITYSNSIQRAFTRTPGGVTVVDSGLCCCVPCLSSAIISLCWFISFQFFSIKFPLSLEPFGCETASIPPCCCAVGNGSVVLVPRVPVCLDGSTRLKVMRVCTRLWAVLQGSWVYLLRWCNGQSNEY